jgi:inner membrane protein
MDLGDTSVSRCEMPFEVSPEQVHWDRAVLSVQIADARAIQEAVTLAWGGRERAFEPGLGDGASSAGNPRGDPATGIHVRLPDLRGGEATAFSLALRLHGSGSLAFAPLGRETEVALRSDWPHPSFQGAWLPQTHEISGDGFAARWKVPYLGRGFPQAWLSDASPGEVVSASRFGVSFVTPVDPYRISQRAAKYDLLFLGLTFLALWLFEVLAGVRVHAVQYLLVGGAMSLFYLLLLAFSEHIGVGAAYAIAAVGIVALIAGYTVAVLRQRRRGAAIGGVVAALYGYLYVLLHNEDHALLVGSVGLFAVLAGVMWLTRGVDWFERVPFGERSDGEATA